jgi:2'-5' RNA ligase
VRRLFFALWPDPVWAERLLAQAQPLISGRTGRPLAIVDLHVTLSFLGEVAAPLTRALGERTAAIEGAAFELIFDAIEYWPRARILAATCLIVPEPARQLAAALQATALELGLSPALNPFRPHVTLLRSVASTDAPATDAHGRIPMPALSLSARGFYLAQSHELVAHTAVASQKCRYERLASWPLRGASAPCLLR